MSATPMNTDLARAEIELTGKRYCACCHTHRPIEGGHKPPGVRPWRCAKCVAHRRAGPMSRRKPT